MLKGSFSHLNYFSQFILLITLVFSFLLFSSLFGILALVPFYGRDILNILTTPNYADPSIIKALKIIQIINMAGGLMLPAIIFNWICKPTQTLHAGFKKANYPVAILLTVLLIVVAQPFIGWTNELNSQLVLPTWLSPLENWMKNAEKQGELITKAFLSTTSIAGLLGNIFMIAILPAFAEEILFRGVLSRLLKEWTRNIHLAVFLSSFIFAAIHMQFYGFLPRFLLGIGLAYLFFWSGSLWLSIVAHFVNNFLSVMLEFLFHKGIIETDAANFGMDGSVYITVVSVILTLSLLFFIYRISIVRSRISD